MNDSNSGIVDFTAYNIFLDERRGSNHEAAFYFAAMSSNTETGRLICTPTHYYY